MNTGTVSIVEKLFALKDEAYRAFQCRLIPTIAPDTVIGVRTPALRALARELDGTEEAGAFLRTLPHRYYEENNLHGFLIERMRGFEEAAAALDAFLPYVDNWATCDQIRPRVFARHLPELAEKATEWMRSPHIYTVRFGIGVLMNHFLGQAFSLSYPDAVASLCPEEYYIRMMVAWYFATALAKRYREVLPYLTERRLDPWTHNKTIRKAIESYRIPAERKAFLRTLTLGRTEEPTF